MIYLDNAATTIPDPEVIDIMATVMNNFYGNPSSSHQAGVEAKTIIEESRKTIADLLNCQPDEIIFTSGGTEAINMVFYNISMMHNIEQIITSTLEHPAVLHSIDHFGLAEKTEFVNILPDATPDLQHLEQLLSAKTKSFVALMHVNNECGSIADAEQIGELCKTYNSLFLCDTVQSIGKIPVDFEKINADFAACSSHKFHGPRGMGFLYKKRSHNFKPHTVGGGQEGGLRSGTENTASIAGLCRALEIANESIEKILNRTGDIKSTLISKIETEIPQIRFAGENKRTIPHILSIAIPENEQSIHIQERLNQAGYAVSVGSACHANPKQSTLLNTIGLQNYFPLRVSFGKFTTAKEVDEFATEFIKTYNLTR